MAKNPQNPDHGTLAAQAATKNAQAQAEEPKAEAPAEPAPAPAGPSPADEIALLKAQLAQVMAVINRPGGAPVEPEEIRAVIQPDHEITQGGTIRPDQGPLHPTKGTPIFNPMYPTRKVGG